MTWQIDLADKDKPICHVEGTRHKFEQWKDLNSVAMTDIAVPD